MREEEKAGLGEFGEFRSAEETLREEALIGESSLDARLSEAIRGGIRAGREEKSRRRRRSVKRWLAISSASALVFVCLLSIRASPAFASMLRDIPGLERFVDLIENGDRGIRLAVENDDYHSLELTDEVDGKSLKVQGIIVDESRLVLFYELRNSEKEQPLSMDRTWINSGIGEIPYRNDGHIGSIRESVTKENGHNIVYGTIEFWQDEGKTNWPGAVTLHLQPKEAPNAAGVASDGSYRHLDEALFQLDFSIPAEWYENRKQEIPIGQVIEAEGQKIEVVKAVVSPLRIAVYLSYDKNNSKQISFPGDMRLVDETGKQWGTNSGHGWSSASEPGVFNNATMFFESTYYDKPNKLTLEGSWFHAIGKDEKEVLLDLDAQKVLKAPDDRLKIEGVTRTSDSRVLLELSISGVASDDNWTYTLFDGYFYTVSGAPVRIMESGNSKDSSSGVQHMYYSLPLAEHPYEQPLRFPLFSYPTYLRQEYRIPLW